MPPDPILGSASYPAAKLPASAAVGAASPGPAAAAHASATAPAVIVGGSGEGHAASARFEARLLLPGHPDTACLLPVSLRPAGSPPASLPAGSGATLSLFLAGEGMVATVAAQGAGQGTVLDLGGFALRLPLAPASLPPGEAVLVRLEQPVVALADLDHADGNDLLAALRALQPQAAAAPLPLAVDDRLAAMLLGRLLGEAEMRPGDRAGQRKPGEPSESRQRTRSGGGSLEAPAPSPSVGMPVTVRLAEDGPTVWLSLLPDEAASHRHPARRQAERCSIRVDFSALGAVSLELRTSEAGMQLRVRSEALLATEARAAIADLFGAACELERVSGSLTFHAMDRSMPSVQPPARRSMSV